MKKNITKLFFTSSLALGTIALPIVFESQNTSSNSVNTSSSQNVNTNQKAVSTNYDAIFSSKTTEAQSSTGGVYGYNGTHNIYLTTYNNTLAWTKDFTQHRVILAAQKDTNFSSKFDASTAKLVSMKVITRNWGGEDKEILYAVIQDSNKKTCVLPYDAVSGEDIITVTNQDGSIDWTKNLFLCDKNDTFMFNESSGIFYIYRYTTISDYATTPVSSFKHYYGLGFQEYTVSAQGWDTNIGVGSSGITNNIIIAMIPIAEGRNVIVYYDKGLTNDAAAAAGKIVYTTNGGTNGNLYRPCVVVADKYLNVTTKAKIENSSLIQPSGILYDTNEPNSPANPPFSQYGYQIKYANDKANSYAMYLVSGTYNSITIYKINNTTGEITVQSEKSLQEGVGSLTGGATPNNNDQGFDIYYTSYDEKSSILYLSNTYSTGGSSMPSLNGKSITGIRINGVTIGENFVVNNSTLGINNGGCGNELKYAIAIYKSNDPNATTGLIASSSSASPTSVSKTQLLSFLPNSSNTGFDTLTSSTRGYFEDFQTLADSIWNLSSSNIRDKKWASEVTANDILANKGVTGSANGLIRASDARVLENASLNVENISSNDEDDWFKNIC